MKIGLQIGKQTGVIISSADSASAFHKLMKIRKIGQEKTFLRKIYSRLPGIFTNCNN